MEDTGNEDGGEREEETRRRSRTRRRGSPVGSPRQQGHEIDQEWELERFQLKKAEEIRQALSSRNELIDTLKDRLQAYQVSYQKAKTQLSKTSTQLRNCEEEKSELKHKVHYLTDQNQILSETEKKLFRDREKLEKSLEKISSSNVELRSLREDTKRLEQVESQMRLEIKCSDEKRAADLAKQRKRYEDEISLMDEQLKQANRKAAEFSRLMVTEKEARIQLEVTLRHAQLEQLETAKRATELEARLAEAEKRCNGEAKRAEIAERRAAQEAARADDSHRARTEEKALFEAEVSSLMRKCEDLEARIERSEAEQEERLNGAGARLDAVTKELRRKTAEVFELENTVRGMTFLAERQLTRAEKEWQARTKQTVDELLTRDKEARGALGRLGWLSEENIRLQNKNLALILQRDVYLVALGHSQALIEIVENPRKTAASTGLVRRWRIRIWSMVFAFSLRNDSRRSRKFKDPLGLEGKPPETSAQSSPLFIWSPRTIVARMEAAMQDRTSKCILSHNELSDSSHILAELKHKYGKTREQIIKLREIEKNMRDRLLYFESRTQSLEIELESTLADCRAYREQNTELQRRLQSYEQDMVAATETLVQDKDQLRQAWELADRKARHLASKLKHVEVRLDQCERDRADALVELEASKEMAARIEKYAEAEIGSLSRLIETSKTSRD